jgi:hypothetical protein
VADAALTDRATKLVERLNRLAEIGQLVDVSDAVRTRAELLVGPASELHGLTAVAIAFRERGIEIDVDVDSIRRMRLQLADLGERYRSDPAQIAAPDGQLRFTLWDPLRQLPGLLRQTLIASWRRHAQALVPPQREEVLDVLQRVPGLRDHAEAIRKLSAEIDERAGMLPQGEPDFDRIEELAASIKARWDELEAGGGIPAEVLQFLAAASLGGAALDLLTPAVRSWLEQRSLLALVRVTMASQ